MGDAHSGLDSPTQTSNQENTPRYTIGQSGGVNFSVEVLSFGVCKGDKQD